MKSNKNLSVLEEFLSKKELDEDISMAIRKMNCRKYKCICAYKDDYRMDLQGFLVDFDIHSFLRDFGLFHIEDKTSVKGDVGEVIEGNLDDCLYLRIQQYLKLKTKEIINKNKENEK